MKKRPVVIWGFRSDYDGMSEGKSIASHAFIHAGYYKAFKAEGYETLWLDDAEFCAGMVPKDALVFCMNCRAEHLPKRPDLFYVGHNLEPRQVEGIRDEQRIGLQYWFTGCPGEYINPYTRWDAGTLYQPWATDLLPHEISDQVYMPQARVVFWVGSVWDDKGMGNEVEMEEMRLCLDAHKVNLRVVRATDHEHANYIRNSIIAPAMQGKWQVDKGYIPCRLFKNVSYGQMAITNNPTVGAMMESSCVLGSSIPEMIDKGLALCCKGREDLTRSAISLVRSKHTYVHRVRQIMEFVP